MSKSHPNVLVLMSDQHSFRYFGTRGPPHGEPVDTPTLDSLARNSAAFDRTYCASPLCTPSRLSMLTGREARNAGAWELESLLKPNLETVPEAFSNAGYETSLVGKMHLGGNRQFAGFDHRPYGDLTGQASHQLETQDPDPLTVDLQGFIKNAGVTDIPESVLQERNVVTESISFLRNHRHHHPEKPWFLCASFSRPHWPRTVPKRHLDEYWPDRVTQPKIGYDAEDPHPLLTARREFLDMDGVTDEEEQYARAAYFACVSYLDEILGDFLRTAEGSGFLDNTIIVYLSDHGELAGEHGLWEKSTWHEGSTRVPLFIQLPSHRSGERDPSTLTTPVSLIDLFPTLCGLTGISHSSELDGVSLSDSVRTGDEPDREPVFVDSYISYRDGLEYRMVVDGQYKYVGFRDAPELFFDLESDTFETTNLAPTTDDSHGAYARLRELVTETVDFEAAERERERDRQLLEEYQLGIPKGTSNQYLWGDNRLIDADSLVYHPRELAVDPDVIFDDFPGGESDD